MKVLLINPFFEAKKFGRFRRFMEPMPCLGLAYIAAVLEKSNVEVEVIDDFVMRLGPTGILKIIKEKQFDIVGISCLTPSAPLVFSIAKEIKRLSKEIYVVLGNIHATIFAEDILKNEAVDVIVHGEGEYAIQEVVKAILDKKDFSQIKGISFKLNGSTIKTPLRESLHNLDELPYPAWHLFPFDRYGFLPFMDVKKPGLSILGSRGCIYHCTFCSLPNIGGEYRERSPKKIVDEFEYLIGRFPIKQISFVDPIFPLTKKFGLDFCEEMIKRKISNKIVWTCETRVDRVDKELLKAMKCAGCGRILYGLESGVQRSLDNINKNFTVNDIKDTLKHTRKAGIQTAGVFMLGLPGETKKMARQTIDFSKRIDLDFAKFAIAVPFPGSQLYDDLLRNGKLKRRDWENFVTFNTNPKELVYIPGGMNPEELINIQRRAHLEFYFRLKIIIRLLCKIRTVSMKYLFLGFLSLLRPWIKRTN